MSILDLNNLLEMTAGDVALQHELFNDFVRIGNQFLVELRALCHASDHEAWRVTAHKFKGIAMTLGAYDLGDLCKQAQDSCSENGAAKQALLVHIQEAFEDVCLQLNQRMTA